MLKRLDPASMMIYGIIALNTLCFVVFNLLEQQQLLTHMALWLPINPHYAHWQWITSIFTHQNFLHLFFNMYALWVFGIAVCIRLGTWRFLTLYLLSALAGSVLYCAFNYAQFLQHFAQLTQYGLSETQIYQQLAQDELRVPITAKETALTVLQYYSQNVIGASGAIFGVFVAFARLYPNTPLSILLIPKTFKAKSVVLVMVLYECFAQLTGWSILGEHIAHLAHIGGAIAGFIITTIFLNASTSPNRQV